MTPQLGLAQEPRGELANPKAALRIPSRSQGFGLSHTHRKCCAHRCSRKLSTGGRLAARMPKNESKTDQRDTQTSTGCSDVSGRTRQSPAMRLSRPPVGWESSPSSAMFLQIEKAIMPPQPAAGSPAAAAPRLGVLFLFVVKMLQISSNLTSSFSRALDLSLTLPAEASAC